MEQMRILVTADGSTESEIAGLLARKLPIPPDASVTVAQVVASLSPAPICAASGVLTPCPVQAANDWREEHAQARETVERIGDEFRARGFSVNDLVLDGDPYEQLFEIVREKAIDLVSLGCGFNGSLLAFFLGSVSRNLVLYAEASTLVGRPYARTDPHESGRRLFEREKLDVLIAVDGSEGSNLALQSLAGVRKPVFRNIYVVAVEPGLHVSSAQDFSRMISGYTSMQDAVEALADEGAEMIRHCCDHVEGIVGYGRPSAEINRIAGEKGADLIMIGANRHGALRRFLVGSCAYETAANAPCSVLILRAVLPLKTVETP